MIKKRIKLILTALVFALVLLGFVGAGQFRLTIKSVAEQIDAHLEEVKTSADKYMESESTIAEKLLAFYDAKAEYMAYLLREGIVEENKETLQEYTGILGVDAICIYTVEDEENPLPTFVLSSNDIMTLKDVEALGGYVLSSTARIRDNRGVFVVADSKEELELFNQVYSWENAIANMGVGNNGLTLICDKKTKEIYSSSNEKLVGKTVKGYEIDKEIQNNLARRAKKEKLVEKGGERPGANEDDLIFYRVGSEWYVGSVVEIAKQTDKDSRFVFSKSYVLCGFSISELVGEYLTNGGIFVIAFLVIIVIFIMYIFFSEEKRKKDPVYAQKLVAFPVLGTFFVICICLFLSQLNMVSSHLISCRAYADNTARMMETLTATTEKMQTFYDKQYLEKCRMAADIITRDEAILTRAGMRELSAMLGVKYTYLFDSKGRVVMTDAPFDHFSLSKNKNDQSYAFRKLLGGYEYLIQDPMPDDSSGEMMQYVGVSVRDEEDRADGFVQIAMQVKELEELYNNVNVSRKLNDVGIGSDGFSFMVKDGIVVKSGKKKLLDKTTEELGLKKNQQADGFSGYLTIGGEKYYVAAAESEEIGLIYVGVPRTGMQKGQGGVIVFTAVITFLCMLVMVRIANKGLDKEACAADQEKEAETLEQKAEKESLGAQMIRRKKRRIKSLIGAWGLTMDEAHAKRWNGRISFAKRTPEGKVIFVVQMALFLFCILVVYMFFFGKMDEDKNSFLMYILGGEWERGPNIFAITASLILVCVITAMVEILDNVLNLIAGISDTKTETICHLLRSLLQYGAVLSVFYYCLALFGFDTKTLVASAGILSVVVGFGAQKLISDVICGLFLVFENQISVGDKVSIGTWSGTITEIGIRTTKIANFDDVKSFNNSEITGLINYSTKKAALIHCEIGMSYEESLEEVAEIFKRELPKIQKNIRGAVGTPYYDGVTRLEDSAIILVFRVLVEPDKRKPAMRDYNRELILLFQRNNIEIPYPKMVIKE